MAPRLISTDEVEGIRVIGGKRSTRRIGKVRRVVFHPSEKRVVGFIVKRPDLLWMFRRKDMFLAADGYEFEDGRMVIRQDIAATDRAACKRLGLDWDSCVLWIGLPILAEDGTELGLVGSAVFNTEDGRIQHMVTDAGMSSNAILGTREIPASMIVGFRRGIGAAIAPVGHEGDQSLADEYGAILVSNAAKHVEVEGGLAEKAGEATARVTAAAGVAARATTEAAGAGVEALAERGEATRAGFVGFKEEFKREMESSKGKGKSSKSTASRRPAALEDGSTSKGSSATSTASGSKTVAKSSAGAGSTSSKASSTKTSTKTSSGSKSATTTSSKNSKSAKSAKQTDSSLDKGARALGKQLKKSSGMFSAFKDEYNKARHD